MGRDREVPVARVVEVSRDELLRRREKVLQSLEVTFEELEERVREANLTEAEWEAWEDLQDIAFLLGDD